jgi:hypothetical protein
MASINNKVWLILLIISFLFVACNSSNKNQVFVWKEFVSEDGQFKATFPMEPKEVVEENEWNNMKVPTHRFEVFTRIYFGVRYSDFPNSTAANSDNFKYIYDYQRDLTLKLANARLVEEKDIWMNKNLGREIIVSRKTFFDLFNQTDIYRFFQIGNRTFQLNTSGLSFSEDAEVDKDAYRFLNSFQVIEE